MRRIEVRLGDRYSMLVIINEEPCRGRYRFVKVRCDCGTIKVVGLNDIRSFRTLSCGCYRDSRVKETCTKHGKSHTPEYRAWWDMVSRCTDETSQSYANYGGRGIMVCGEWVDNFTNFLNHIGPKPNKKATLDRTDNNRGYFPGNVRWVPHLINNTNKRTSKRWIINGVEYVTLTIASSDLGVHVSTLTRWCKGWKCYRTGKMYPPKNKCGVRRAYE